LKVSGAWKINVKAFWLSTPLDAMRAPQGICFEISKHFTPLTLHNEIVS